MRQFSSIVILAAFLFTETAAQDSMSVSPSVVDEKDEITYSKLDVNPAVNMLAWRKHLEVKLVPVVERAAKKKAPAGKYIVNVRFIVERDGSISNVTALNDPGYGLAEGAVSVVKTGPKWSPGKQNGKKVRAYFTQPVYFMIVEE